MARLLGMISTLGLASSISSKVVTASCYQPVCQLLSLRISDDLYLRIHHFLTSSQLWSPKNCRVIEEAGDRCVEESFCVKMPSYFSQDARPLVLSLFNFSLLYASEILRRYLVNTSFYFCSNLAKLSIHLLLHSFCFCSSLLCVLALHYLDKL